MKIYLRFINCLLPAFFVPLVIFAQQDKNNFDKKEADLSDNNSKKITESHNLTDSILISKIINEEFEKINKNKTVNEILKKDLNLNFCKNPRKSDVITKKILKKDCSRQIISMYQSNNIVLVYYIHYGIGTHSHLAIFNTIPDKNSYFNLDVWNNISDIKDIKELLILGRYTDSYDW